jgi:hypothetical protein
LPLQKIRELFFLSKGRHKSAKQRLCWLCL